MRTMRVVICSMGLLHVLLFVYPVGCFDFKVQLMSFDVKLVGPKEEGRNSLHFRAVEDSMEADNNRASIHLRAFQDSKENQDSKYLHKKTTGSSEETTPKVPIVSTQKKRTKDCLYQYPEKKQVDLILSNMMNELTLVFVKASEWLKEKITRRTSKLHNADEIRRALETRFKVSHRKRRDFFEDIYHNMTKDYRSFYYKTTQRTIRKGRDACLHQNEVKKQWHDLLERSLDTLKKAVRHCVGEYLNDQDIDPESALGSRVNSYLVKELKVIRSNQLKLLCEKFQLCYDEILQEFRWKTNMRADNFR